MAGPSDIQALIWDLGGVLVRTEGHRARFSWEARLGLQPHQLERTFFDSPAGEAAMVGEGDVEDVWDWLMQRFSIPAVEREMLIADFWSGDRLDRQLLAMISSLRSTYRIALLSNAFRQLRPLLETTWGIADHFDEIVISAEVGMRKPDPRIYRLALERLALLPEQTVFIDDQVDNLQAAAELGMHTVLFRDRHSALDQLSAVFGHPL